MKCAQADASNNCKLKQWINQAAKLSYFIDGRSGNSL